ncbi:MAG TPA: hypothetical protein VEI97_12835 [bacterium]|nr:hypothetical protein [bacterium]
MDALDLVFNVAVMFWAAVIGVLGRIRFGEIVVIVLMVAMFNMAVQVYVETRMESGGLAALCWAVAVWFWPPLLIFWYLRYPARQERREELRRTLEPYYAANVPHPTVRHHGWEDPLVEIPAEPLSHLPTAVDPLNDDPDAQRAAWLRRRRRAAGERVRTGSPRLEPEELMAEPWEALGADAVLSGGLPPLPGLEEPGSTKTPTVPSFQGVHEPRADALFLEGRYAEAADLLDDRIREDRALAHPVAGLEQYLAVVRTHQIHEELKRYRVAKNTGHFLTSGPPGTAG